MWAKSVSAILFAVFATAASAQIQTTPNLIDPAGTAWGIPSSQVLNTGQISQIEGAGYTTGTAYYNSSTNTIRFGYLPSTISQTIAINQALSGTGIQINGFNWSYQWMNGGENSGSLGVAILLSDPTGSTLESQVMSHAVQQTASWNLEQGTKTFTNPYALISTGYLSMSISGQDDRFWMGLYGPRVRDVSLGLNYSTDPCAADPLSSPSCPGYAAAFFTQQCTANPLYDASCPGYAAAFFTQQCTISALYSPSCPGYAQAYALKYIVNAPTTSTNTEATDSDPVSSASAVVSDPVVNDTISATATSASPAQAATATVPLVAAPQPVTATVPPTEQKKTESATSAESKDQPRTARQELQERRQAAARAQAIEQGKNLANAMGEAATMEAQVTAQASVMQAMAFTPGFDAYGRVTLPDAQGYRPFEIYAGQRNVDNPAGRRFLTGSDSLHAEMVDQQYGALAR